MLLIPQYEDSTNITTFGIDCISAFEIGKSRVSAFTSACVASIHAHTKDSEA